MTDVILVDASGTRTRKVRLGKELASGGAGAVHEVNGEPEIVVKLYNTDTLRDHGRDYEIKIERMLHHVPTLPSLPELGIVQLAWPIAIARGISGGFVGFAMPRLDFRKTENLESFMQPRLAKSKNLRTDLGARITVAANLAGVVSAIHEKGHQIVDLKPPNLQFYKQELYVAVLDCDGFAIQVSGYATSAPQATPDYLATEFQGKRITNQEQQDRFALAVILFQLLNFGIHPYSGTALDPKAPTDKAGTIAKGLYAYGVTPNSKVIPHPASAHPCIPDEIRILFDRAFGPTFNKRPSAREWVGVLHRYALTRNALLEPCNAGHLWFSGQPCGECHRNAIIHGAASPVPPSVSAPKNKAPRAHPSSQSTPPNPISPAPAPKQQRVFRTSRYAPSNPMPQSGVAFVIGELISKLASKKWLLLILVTFLLGYLNWLDSAQVFLWVIGGYLGYKSARDWGWWRFFAFIVGVPLGFVATAGVVALTEIVLMPHISGNKQQVINDYDAAKNHPSPQINTGEIKQIEPNAIEKERNVEKDSLKQSLAPTHLQPNSNVIVISKNASEYINGMIQASINHDDASIKSFKEKIESFPKPKKGNRKIARNFNDKGLSLLKSGYYAGSLTYFENALVNDPSDVEIINNYGFALQKNGNLQKAQTALISALALEPGRASAWANLGSVYAMLKDSKKALACYSNTYRFSKNTVKTHEYFTKLLAEETNSSVKLSLQAVIDEWANIQQSPIQKRITDNKASEKNSRINDELLESFKKNHAVKKEGESSVSDDMPLGDTQKDLTSDGFKCKSDNDCQSGWSCRSVVGGGTECRVIGNTKQQTNELNEKFTTDAQLQDKLNKEKAVPKKMYEPDFYARGKWAATNENFERAYYDCKIGAFRMAQTDSTGFEDDPNNPYKEAYIRCMRGAGFNVTR